MRRLWLLLAVLTLGGCATVGYYVQSAQGQWHLLASSREIDRLFGQAQTKGLTVVPLSMYLKGPWVKVSIALVQGKKLHDKRDTLKRKEANREMEKAIKNAQR